jgi:AbrB family looped-hinge helix DNA binding protein
MARILANGNVTIPKAIREATGFLPGVDVEVIEKDGDIFIVRTNLDAPLTKKRQRDLSPTPRKFKPN